MWLIDADELLQCGADVVRDCGLYCDFGYSADIIDEQPAVDAVQVVRCKDCIHRNHIESGLVKCEAHKCMMGVDDYCSYGEREDGTQ